MADFLLEVGIDSVASKTNFETSITKLITEIQSDTKYQPHIKVALDIDWDALEKFRDRIQEITSHLVSTGGMMGLSSGMANANSEFIEMADKLTTIRTLFTDINRENQKIQKAYSKALGGLGGLPESPENTSDINALQQAYAQYNEQLKRLRANKAEITIEDIQQMHQVQAEIAEIISRIQARDDAEIAVGKAKKAAAAESAKADVEDINNETQKFNRLKKIDTLQRQISRAQATWTKSRSGTTSEEYNKLKIYNDELETLSQKLRNNEISREEFDRDFASINERFANTSKVVSSAGENVQKFGDRIKGLATKFGSWLSVSQVIMAAVRAMKQMISNAREISAALTQLKIVTGATDAEMRKFSETAFTLAKNLGKSTPEVIKSIETFSRLGYSLKDASKLAEYATILSNVAAVSSDEATTGLTSIIKGYNLKVEDAEHVADILVSVGQKYAVSAGEMMEAYEKSGAALHATNTSLEKSAGLIAAANASVQDASVIGTAIKTVSARIRGSKTDLEELGENTEDLAEGFSKYAEEIKALTGFDIMIDKNNFKDLYDIMEGIAGTWDKLSDTQKARVSEILGGTRQLQVISSIIGNWKDAVGAYDTALKSAGASTQANAKYMDDISAHINQLKAAFEELSKEVMNSDFMKFIVDVGKKIIEVLTQISKSTGSIVPLIIGGKLLKGLKSIS